MQKLARLIDENDFERRAAERRGPGTSAVLSTHKAFAREERGIFRQLERRRELRRTVDVRRGIAAVE